MKLRPPTGCLTFAGGLDLRGPALRRQRPGDSPPQAARFECANSSTLASTPTTEIIVSGRLSPARSTRTACGCAEGEAPSHAVRVPTRGHSTVGRRRLSPTPRRRSGPLPITSTGPPWPSTGDRFWESPTRDASTQVNHPATIRRRVTDQASFDEVRRRSPLRRSARTLESQESHGVGIDSAERRTSGRDDTQLHFRDRAIHVAFRRSAAHIRAAAINSSGSRLHHARHDSGHKHRARPAMMRETRRAALCATALAVLSPSGTSEGRRPISSSVLASHPAPTRHRPDGCAVPRSRAAPHDRKPSRPLRGSGPHAPLHRNPVGTDRGHSP